MWTPAYIRLFVFEAFSQMGMQIVAPVTSNMALALGTTVAIAGFFAGLSSMVALVVRIVSGPIVSRFPQKELLLVATAGFMLSSFFCAFGGSIPLLGASRVLYGVALVFRTVLVVAIAARIVDEELVGQGVAWIGLCNVAGVALGAIVASALGRAFGYHFDFLVSGICFALSLLVGLGLPHLSAAQNKSEPATNDKGSSLAGLFGRLYHIGSLPLALMGVFEASLFGTVSTLTLTVGDIIDLPQMSIYFAVYAVVAFIARPFSGKLYDKYGFKKACLPMCVMLMLSMVTFMFTDSTIWVVIDGALFALGQGCLWPCMQAEAVKGIPQDKTPLAVNTLYLGVDVGMMFGPTISGFFLGLAGPSAMYLFNAIIGACLVVYVFPYSRIKERQRARLNEQSE